MGLIDKNAILTAEDLKTETVDVPEWKGSVKVRELTAEGLVGFWNAVRDDKGELKRDQLQPALLMRTIVDANGDLMFDEQDVAVLMTKSAAAVGRIYKVAQSINGLGAEPGEPEKNSAAAQSGG